jgi:GNAT superfamily N-acetyltransferase
MSGFTSPKKSLKSQANLVAVRYSERPELWERTVDLSAQVWPEYNLHGGVLNFYWGRLYEAFPEYQFVLYDEEGDEVLAEGHTIRCCWDETVLGLGPGIDATIAAAFHDHGSGAPNALSALAAEILPAHQDQGLSSLLLKKMQGIARSAGLKHLIAPVRPAWKERYPLMPIEHYITWTNEQGQPFDPWIRTHVRLGGQIARPIPESMRITGTVADWESWTNMAFPESGDYVFPRCLAPLHVDRPADVGTYWEPNVWIVRTTEVRRRVRRAWCAGTPVEGCAYGRSTPGSVPSLRHHDGKCPSGAG